jgi:hypothetical protein
MASASENADEVAGGLSAASALLKFVLDEGLDAQVAGLEGVAQVCEKLKFRECKWRSLKIKKNNFAPQCCTLRRFRPFFSHTYTYTQHNTDPITHWPTDPPIPNTPHAFHTGCAGDRSLMDIFFRTLYEIEAVLEGAVHRFAAISKKNQRMPKALAQIQSFVTYLETAEEEA